MSTPSKIQAIKAHAAEIAEGTPSGSTSADRKSLLFKALTGAATGASIGAAAGHTLGGVMGLNPGYRAPLFGAITMAGAGALSAFLASHPEVQKRKALRAQLETTAANPSDSNAIGALAIQGIHSRSQAGNNRILEYIANKVHDSAASSIHGQIERDMILSKTNGLNFYKPAA
jgi:hypothetical protein